MIELTLLTKIGGALTKSIDRGADGKINIDGSACLMTDGSAQRIKFGDISAAAEFIGNRKRSEAVALGRLRADLPDTVKITTVDRLERLNGTAPANLIARTSAYIAYAPREPALALVDIDTKGMTVEVADRIAVVGEIHDCLSEILPPIATTSRFLRRSTSSGIRMIDTGEEFPASKGFHLYLAVADGADVVRFLKDFHDRAWLAGFGWHMIGGAGQLLDRSVIDRMVGAGERLIFEGKPDLGWMVEQDQKARAPVVYHGDVMDTLAFCPPLTPEERTKVDELKAASVDALQPASDAERERFIATHAAKLVKDKGLTIEQARNVIHQMTHGDVLPDGPLPWDRKEFAGCTARDILADPKRFVGQTMADPLEGVAYGRCKAKVYRRKDGSLLINSQAHGGKVYQIKHEPPDDEPSPPDARTSKRRKVRGEIEEGKSPGDGPVIQVVAGKLHITTTLAEDALIASGLPIYQRGDGLVQPVVREVPASRGRTTLAAGLGEMNVYSLVDLMCATATYERYDARSEDWVRINPPAQVAQTLLSRQGKWHFPPVAGIITTPTLRPDGTLLTAPGYDAVTRLYHVADPSLRLHPEVHNPTRDLAERALKVLEGLLSEFMFVGAVDKAVALSGIITPIVRGAMPVAPLHAINAHAAGSGKSFLVDVVSLISTGRPCPVATAAPDETETEKRIVGLLLAGYPIVSIDNCNGELGGDLLCQAIERPLIRIRRLGGSDIFEIESSVTIFATGNNLRVRGDMVRRSLIAAIDPQMERPELRKYTHDPEAMILADRGRYVSACLVIVRAYILHGCPNKLDPIASFREWSNLVRSALVWLGCTDPARSMEAAREDDPELNELREVISAWRTAFGYTATTCKAAIAALAEKVAPLNKEGERPDYAPKTEPRYPDLQTMLLQVAGARGAVDAKKLGTWLKNREGKIVGKERFERDGITEGSARWKLRRVNKSGTKGDEVDRGDRSIRT